MIDGSFYPCHPPAGTRVDYSSQSFQKYLSPSRKPEQQGAIMQALKKIAVGVALIATTAACAPAFGPQPRILASRSGLQAVAPCFLYGDGLTALQLSSGPRFWSQRAQAYQLQSRFGLAAYDVRSQMSSWKQVAAGC